MRYNCILFDFDGTLCDTAAGVMGAYRIVLGRLGIPIPTEETLKSFVGPPLFETFTKVFELDTREAIEAVNIFREVYAEGGARQYEIFNGVPEMLAALREAGARLAVATSKMEEVARRMCCERGIEKYFELIAGSLPDNSRSGKEQIISFALERLGLPDAAEALMVGDRFYDVVGAKKRGMRSMGVLYGYGSRGELAGAGADYLAESPEEVARQILGMK
ncbi:MAG: HAD hydrolase-like protein [Oscillospiraceae bacterium]|jgi:phosphoglycolate phosphatase|nr:HAD hydrolase-like protein [Oscillospiraceae bacterium]